MSEKPKFESSVKPKRNLRELGGHLKRQAKTIGVVATSFLAFEAPFNAQQASASPSRNRAEVVQIAGHNSQRHIEAASSLRSIKELPGYGKEVSPSQMERLKNATVKIVEKYKEGNKTAYSQETCSGTKVIIGGQEYIMTASHCFTSLTGAESGLIQARPNGPKAGNLYGLSQNLGHSSSGLREHMDYEIVDPALPLSHGGASVRDSMPIAKATGISISLEGTDFALLKVGQERALTVSKGGTLYRPRALDEVGSIPYPGRNNAALPGQEAVIYSVPAPVAGNPGSEIGATGHYLGSLKLPGSRGQNSRTVEVVAINVVDGQDPCYSGGSGASALLADGHELGPLTQVYESNNGKQWTDAQRQMGILIPKSQYNRLCLFSTVNRDSVNDIVKGFGDNLSESQLSAMQKE